MLQCAFKYNMTNMFRPTIKQGVENYQATTTMPCLLDYSMLSRVDGGTSPVAM
jgi:hypothetical protein